MVLHMHYDLNIKLSDQYYAHTSILGMITLIFLLYETED